MAHIITRRQKEGMKKVKGKDRLCRLSAELYRACLSLEIMYFLGHVVEGEWIR